jgi:hypothetical protein
MEDDRYRGKLAVELWRLAGCNLLPQRRLDFLGSRPQVRLRQRAIPLDQAFDPAGAFKSALAQLLDFRRIVRRGEQTGESQKASWIRTEALPAPGRSGLACNKSVLRSRTLTEVRAWGGVREKSGVRIGNGFGPLSPRSSGRNWSSAGCQGWRGYHAAGTTAVRGGGRLSWRSLVEHSCLKRVLHRRDAAKATSGNERVKSPLTAHQSCSQRLDPV